MLNIYIEGWRWRRRGWKKVRASLTRIAMVETKWMNRCFDVVPGTRRKTVVKGPLANRCSQQCGVDAGRCLDDSLNKTTIMYLHATLATQNDEFICLIFQCCSLTSSAWLSYLSSEQSSWNPDSRVYLNTKFRSSSSMFSEQASTKPIRTILAIFANRLCYSS